MGIVCRAEDLRLDLSVALKFPHRTGCLRSTGAGKKSCPGSLVAVSSRQATNQHRLWTFSRAVIEEPVHSAARAGGMTKASRWSHKNDDGVRLILPILHFQQLPELPAHGCWQEPCSGSPRKCTCDSAHLPCFYARPKAVANPGVQNTFSDLPPYFRLTGHHDRTDHLALSHRQQVGRWRDGCCLQSRGHGPWSLCRVEVSVRTDSQRCSSAGTLATGSLRYRGAQPSQYLHDL